MQAAEPVPGADEQPSVPGRLKVRSVLDRLVAVQRAAERAGRHAEAAALNGVIVSVSEAKHKARQARAVVDTGIFSLLDELEAL